MKLFSNSATWSSIRTDDRLNGVSAISVEMQQVAGLAKSIKQLETMKSIKPNSNELAKAIEVLRACKAQIMKVIQSPMTKSLQEDLRESPASEGDSFNRRP